MSFLWIYQVDEAGECLCSPFGRHVAPSGIARWVRRGIVLSNAGGMSAQLTGKNPKAHAKVRNLDLKIGNPRRGHWQLGIRL